MLLYVGINSQKNLSKTLIKALAFFRIVRKSQLLSKSNPGYPLFTDKCLLSTTLNFTTCVLS